MVPGIQTLVETIETATYLGKVVGSTQARAPRKTTPPHKLPDMTPTQDGRPPIVGQHFALHHIRTNEKPHSRRQHDITPHSSAPHSKGLTNISIQHRCLSQHRATKRSHIYNIFQQAPDWKPHAHTAAEVSCQKAAYCSRIHVDRAKRGTGEHNTSVRAFI